MSLLLQYVTVAIEADDKYITQDWEKTTTHNFVDTRIVTVRYKKLKLMVNI